MSDDSPFFNEILSPPTALNIGAAMLSPDETPLVLKAMHGSVMRTPALLRNSTPFDRFDTSLRAKKRQRDDHVVSSKDRKEGYRILPGKDFRLQPFVVRLLEEVVSRGTTEILKQPLLPDRPETEPEDRRKMRLHLRNRFLPVSESKSADLIEFTQKLIELWGGKLLMITDHSFNVLTKGNDLSKFITPLRRTRGDQKGVEKLEDLRAEDLLHLDFLDEDVSFSDVLQNAPTADDNWACGRNNPRRVTCHETPRPIEESEVAPAAADDEGSEPKLKKAKTSNPKRGMRWTTAERKLFLQGLERWGAGNWKSIHKIIPGRTYVQVKSMGVYLVSKFHMSRGQGPSKAVTDYLMATTNS